MAAKKKPAKKRPHAPAKRTYRKARAASDPTVPTAELVKKIGRPSIYGPEILNETVEYLTKTEVPLIAGLARHLNVTRQTVHAWAVDSDKPEFAYIIESLFAKQEEVVMTKGLNNQFHPTYGRMLLGKHGYSMPASIAVSGDENRPPVGLQHILGETEIEVEVSDEEASRRYYALLHPKVHGA